MIPRLKWCNDTNNGFMLNDGKILLNMTASVNFFLGQHYNMKTYIAEFIGTLVFLTCILKSNGDPYIIAGGLLVAIHLMGDISGDFNPAVTFMSYLNGNYANNQMDAVYKVCSQMLGGAAAIHLANLGKMN